MVPATRREARERIVSLLYEADSKQVPVTDVLADLPVPPDAFVTEIVTGVESERTRIDTLLADHAVGWALDRMPVVDLAILRMATYELLDRPDVPAAVAISEAVDLAKQYSTEESGRFVNGVLGTISALVRPES